VNECLIDFLEYSWRKRDHKVEKTMSISIPELTAQDSVSPIAGSHHSRQCNVRDVNVEA
jgi:hypothetical protein